MDEDAEGGQGEITQLLVRWRRGDRQALDDLLPLVYRALRDLARRQRRRRSPELSLNTTALVHEAYLKLVDQTQVKIHDRQHFFALASRAMRHILVDYARRRLAAKRGGGERMSSLFEGDKAPIELRAAEVLSLDEALTHLQALDPRLGRLVELRFYGGLSMDEVGGILEVSPRTLRRDWLKARAFLANELKTATAR